MIAGQYKNHEERIRKRERENVRERDAQTTSVLMHRSLFSFFGKRDKEKPLPISGEGREGDKQR